jgi:hypothetical protein
MHGVGRPGSRPLQRILGLGFGSAPGFGSTVGVGILRLPGTLAAALGDSRLGNAVSGHRRRVCIVWRRSGVRAGGDNAGGWRILRLRTQVVRRAGGFVIGWSVTIAPDLARLSRPELLKYLSVVSALIKKTDLLATRSYLFSTWSAKRYSMVLRTMKGWETTQD